MTAEVPNHHGDHPGFSGIVGAAAGLSMLIGRGSVGRLAVDVAGIGPADRVVDVGCGPGNAARRAAGRGATVVAVDPAPVMLGLARLATRSGTAISWIGGAAEGLPLPDDWATVVWSLATVHHWPDLDGGISEALRVVAGGGRLLVIERRTRPGARGLASHGWTRSQAEAFATACQDAGFLDVAVEIHQAGLTRRPQLVVNATAPLS